MQAGKSGGLCEGMFRCRDHQKEQIASANALKALTDGDVTCDPRVQGARGHGASPQYESSERSRGDDSTGKGARCPAPWQTMSSVVLRREPPCEPQTLGDR